jgi:hypothetical protein
MQAVVGTGGVLDHSTRTSAQAGHDGRFGLGFGGRSETDPTLSRVGAQTLEQLLTDVTAHDSSPFREVPGAEAPFDHTPAVDVSSAAMTRLRTPFGVEG